MTKHIDRFNQLKNVYKQFIEDPKNSKLRIRDVSSRLNVSEAELLSLSKISNNLLDISLFARERPLRNSF